jgi:DNA-binding XRE family transcriptional regulator
MKTRRTGAATEIVLIVPNEEAKVMQAALTGFLNLAGHEVSLVNENGSGQYKAEELFPEPHPGMHLRGLRVREDMSQQDMAEKLGLRPHHLSAMEKGTIPISLEMAKRIEEKFNISHRVFL